MKNIVILCDFDGTITNIDTAFSVLENFTQGDWLKYDDLLEKEEISLEECMTKQFAMIRGTEDEMIDYVMANTSISNTFDKLEKYCNQNHILLIIVSGGLDFIIRHYIQTNNWNVGLVAAKTKITNNGIRLEFPKKIYHNSGDFKADLTKYYQNQEKRVIFIGDGLADFEAVKIADHNFIVKGSRLAKYCIKNRINFKEMDNFSDVIDFISLSKNDNII